MCGVESRIITQGGGTGRAFQQAKTRPAGPT